MSAPKFIHDIRRCKECGELYCYSCSDLMVEFPDKYCTPECENSAASEPFDGMILPRASTGVRA